MGESAKIKLTLSLGPETRFGPGKADLLQGIRETGSIAAAGRAMGMSYKRAWYLIETLNTTFQEPLVASSKGGARGGGAVLTETGGLVLDLYRQMESEAATATEKTLNQLARLADEVKM